MPVDYSKWDALELSDDSDIEVHPNVDKRSFIRAKQQQIHMEREQRKHQIATLRYERQINDGLMRRISALLASLRAHAADAAAGGSPGEVAFRAVVESAAAARAEDDQPPPRPEGVHAGEEPLPTYSKMMATLLDQVNRAVEERRVGPDARYAAVVAEVEDHLRKVQGLQADLAAKLAELEREEARKITSESIHTGFDSSHVNRSAPSGPAAQAAPPGRVELLNPGAAGSSGPEEAPAGAPPAAGGDDEEDMEASPLAKRFAALPAGDYQASLAFLSEHPQILTERETDGLLVMAFDAQLEGRDDAARQCVHQALLLQYCRALGRDGVALFFRRITTRGHQARDVFLKDVQDTYARIRTRAREIDAQRAAAGPGGDAGDVEQIQLHAVEPGTVISIRIPPAGGADPAERRGRAIFEAFAPGMRRALETGSLDEVNKVLGTMPVGEAEDLVGKLGEAGILSLEEQIIDATTEEGQAQLRQMEEQAAATTSGSQYADDPE